MLEYSHMTTTLEILWIVLAFCALWVAAFLCWAIYHIAMVARNIHLVLDEARHGIAQVEAAIAKVHDKLEHHAKILDPLVALAGSVVREVKEAKSKKTQE